MRTVGALAAGGILLVASACASGPRPARPGNPLRVTTVAGDTITGEMVVVRADTLILAREGIGVEALPLGTIRTVEVDRSRVRAWSRPVYCFVGGVGVAATAYEIAEYGWNLDLVPSVLMFGLSGWDCIDTRPDWKPGRFEPPPPDDRENVDERGLR